MIFFANCFDAGDLDHSTIRLPSCPHIQSAAECSISEYPTISLSIEALSSFPFPKMVKEQLEEMGKTHRLDHLIMQVSEKSFAVYAPFHRDQSSLTNRAHSTVSVLISNEMIACHHVQQLLSYLNVAFTSTCASGHFCAREICNKCLVFTYMRVCSALFSFLFTAVQYCISYMLYYC